MLLVTLNLILKLSTVLRLDIICCTHMRGSTKSYLGNQIEKNGMGGASSAYGEKSGAYTVMVGRPEGRRPLGRPRLRWEDNIKRDIQEVGWSMD
jgi:hypothetical protein